MAVHICRTKKNAEKYARRMRRKGFKASTYNVKGKGYGVSVTRK